MDGNEDSLRNCYGSYRFRLALIVMFMSMLSVSYRITISFAIVCMVNHTAVYDLKGEHSSEINTTVIPFYDNKNNTFTSDILACEMENVKDTSVLENGPFVWDKAVQAHILGSFFYGYLLSQIPSGYLAERLGSKWLLAGQFGVTATCVVLVPVAAKISYICVVLLRVIIGLAQGVILPSLHAFWSRWAPPNERSRLSCVTLLGGNIGLVVVTPLAGVLCGLDYGGGWPLIFYISGALSLIVLPFWIIYASDTPENNTKISKSEQQYIVRCLKDQVYTKEKRKHKVLWGQILRSKAVWAVFIANLTTDWGFYMFLSYVPTYMREILKFNIKSNGFVSSIPFLARGVTMVVGPTLADTARSKYQNRSTIGKIIHCLGALGTGVFLLVLSALDCTQPYIAVAMMSLGVATAGIVYSGFPINLMDVAPKYAGTILGISNGVCSVTGFIVPYVVATLTPMGTHSEWKNVFYLAASIYAAGCIFYCIFGSGELQPWAVNAEELRDKSNSEIFEMETFMDKNAEQTEQTKM